MSVRVYNKLVRDLIPNIIRSTGSVPIIKQLSTYEYQKELEKKLKEEVAEYFNDNTIEELADIVEVIYAILESKNITLEAFENLRKEKTNKRGGFKDRIFLEKVLEE